MDAYRQERLVLLHGLGIQEQTDVWAVLAQAPSGAVPVYRMGGADLGEVPAATDALSVNAPVRSAASFCGVRAVARSSAVPPDRLASEAE